MRPFVLLLLVSLTCLVSAKRPNIIFILFDDLGWGDVGFSKVPEIPTPNLMKLRRESLELTRFYAQPKCTPSRAALMTGRYPFTMGLQTNKVFTRFKDNYLSLEEKLLPAYLKDLGYTTHMVGKWHLGNCHVNATPIRRGFNSFFGPWANVQDHFTQKVGDGYDWTWNLTAYPEAKGKYNTHLITNHTQYLLREHFNHAATANDPLFLYVAYLAPHKPGQAPDSYVKNPKCAEINYPGNEKMTKKRRIFCGMVAALDEGVGNITKTLKDLGVLDDFIIILTSDNGAAINVAASSWPLRGNKQTVYEGGTRARTLLRAPKFLKNPTGQYDGLIHITDILPTLYEAAGGDPTTLPEKIDGRSAWYALNEGKPTDREWMVYNIDKDRKLGAIALKNETHDFKLVYHEKFRVSGWRSQDPRPEEVSALDKRPGGVKTNGNYYRLFNLATNPEEREPSQEHPDAALQFPGVFQLMKSKLDDFTALVVDVPKYNRINQKTNPGNPKNNNGSWGVGGC